jgi:hypothetical protein
VDRVVRRWFAIGLTLTVVGDLLYDFYELTGRILLPQLNDTLFLSLGPASCIGLAVVLRRIGACSCARSCWMSLRSRWCC